MILQKDWWEFLEKKPNFRTIMTRIPYISEEEEREEPVVLDVANLYLKKESDPELEPDPELDPEPEENADAAHVVEDVKINPIFLFQSILISNKIE